MVGRGNWRRAASAVACAAALAVSVTCLAAGAFLTAVALGWGDLAEAAPWGLLACGWLLPAGVAGTLAFMARPGGNVPVRRQQAMAAAAAIAVALNWVVDLDALQRASAIAHAELAELERRRDMLEGVRDTIDLLLDGRDEAGGGF